MGLLILLFAENIKHSPIQKGQPTKLIQLINKDGFICSELPCYLLGVLAGLVPADFSNITDKISSTIICVFSHFSIIGCSCGKCCEL